MDDQQLLRYSRQIMLAQMDIEGQDKLLSARVLIVGAGGLGCPAAMYLACAGVGHISIADHDHVELSNLQRQIAHHTADIGTNKAISTQKTLKNLNAQIHVTALTEKLSGERLKEAVAKADVVLDCSDNFSTRFAINAACVALKKPLVSGAAIRFEGQVSVFNLHQHQSPCYHCLYDDHGDERQNCATHGVIAPIVGMVGSTQALEAIKVICNIGQTLDGRLLVIDGLTMEMHSVRLRKNTHCRVCAVDNSMNA